MSHNRFTYGIEQELLVRQKLISLGCRAMSSPHRDHALKVDVEITHIGVHRLNWPVDLQLSLKKNAREKIKDFFDSRTDINYRLSIYVRFDDGVEVEDVAAIIKKHILNLNSFSNMREKREKRYMLTIRNGEQSLVPYPQYIRENGSAMSSNPESHGLRSGKIVAIGAEGVTIADVDGRKYHAMYTDFFTINIRDFFVMLKKQHLRRGLVNSFRSKTLEVRFKVVEETGQPARATLVQR